MPSYTDRQRRFFGAQLARVRAGKKSTTGMSEQQLADMASLPLQKPASMDQGGSATVGPPPKLQPLAPVGQPLPPMPAPQPANLRIPEPAALVGLNTGTVHAVMGDNPAGPETMSVTPPAASLAPGPADITLGREFSQMGGSSRPLSMAGGGTATVGYYNQDWMNPSSTQNNPVYNQQAFGTPVFDNDYYRQLRQNQRQAAGQSLSAQGSVLGAENTYLGSQYSSLGARQAVLPYSYGALAARQATLPSAYNVLSATQNTFAPRQAQLQAQQGVLGAQTQSLAAQRGLIGQEQGFNAQELADLQKIIAARTNVADQTAVAQEAQRRGVENQDYARLGVSAPVDVNTAPGQEGTVAPGTRAALMSQEDIAKQRASDTASQNANTLRSAQLAVQLQDTNVTQAQAAAQQAGLTLAQANMMVDQARNQQGYSQLGAQGAGYAEDYARLGATAADYGTQQAGLDVTGARNSASLTDLQGRVIANQISDLQAPTDQGYELYTDPNTGQRSWMSPAQADAASLLQQRQTRLGVDQAVIPQEYGYQQATQSFRNQQGPLPGYTISDISGLFESNPSFALDRGPGSMYEQVLGWFMQQYGVSRQTAVARAEAVIQNAVNRAYAAPTWNNGGGNAPPSVNVPLPGNP